MQFDRVKLIETIDKQLEVLRKKDEEELLDLQQKWDLARANWQQDWMPKWEQVATSINQLLAAGDVIESMQQVLKPVSLDYYRSEKLATWKEIGPSIDRPTAFENRTIISLVNLRAVLDAAEDQKVSETSLNKMGYKLTDLVKYAA